LNVNVAELTNFSHCFSYKLSQNIDKSVQNECSYYDAEYDHGYE